MTTALERSVEPNLDDTFGVFLVQQFSREAQDIHVEVTAAQQLVQPTPALQNLIDARQVQELPLNNRNFVQLATLAPGVSSDLPDEVGIGLTSTVSLSIAGARRNAVNWFVDGASNVDVGSNITLLSTPTLESIEEFKNSMTGPSWRRVPTALATRPVPRSSSTSGRAAI